MQLPAALRLIFTLFCFIVCLAVTDLAHATVTITRTSSPVFYSDLGNGLSGTYVAYRITTDTAITDAWAEIGNFTGPYISLGNNETGVYHIGSMGVGSKMAYFYLKTSAVSGNTEYHTVSVYSGNPTTGTRLGYGGFAMTQQNSIQANSNKVSQVVAGPIPSGTLGGVVTITVTGDTGTTGGNMAFTAATDPNWPASTYRLYQSVIDLPDGSTLTDAPYTPAYNGPTGTYIATYSFIAVNTIAAPTATSSTGYILSGQQMKHTQTGGSAGAPAPPPISTTSGNTVLLKKSCDTLSLPPLAGGTVTFTLRLENSGSADATVDDFVDTLPAGVSYVASSTTYNGASYPDPVISGSTLTWSGSFLVPAGGAKELTFRASIPGTTGTYTNAAVSHIGSVQIDSTLVTTDNAPATASVTVSAATVLAKKFTPDTIGVNQQSTLTFTLSNSSGSQSQSGLGFTDTLPAGVTLVGAANASQCGGTVSYTGNNVINFSNGTLGSGASCTITATVTSGTEGSYTNSYSSSSPSNITNLTGTVVATGASATLQVAAPTLTKSFNPSTINANQGSAVMFQVSSPSAQSGFGFTDTLPSGVVVAGSPSSPPTVTNSCGGTVAPLSGGESVISFSGGTLSGGTCSISVPVRVTSSTLTTYTNATGNVTVTGGLKNNASAQLTVVSTPTLKKSFVPNIVGSGLPSTLTFTINNSTGSTQSNLSFSDLFAGIVVASPASYAFSNCAGGSMYRYGSSNSAPSGGDAGVQVQNLAVAANTTCTVTINVTATKPGSYQNNANNIGNLNGLVYSETLPSLKVEGVTVKKAFGAPYIFTGGNSSLTFTINNGADLPAQGGISFTDTLPSGLNVYGPPLTPQCGGSVSYGTNGSGADTITFSGGSLSLNTVNCPINTSVTSSTPALYTNNFGNFSATADGVDASTASASLTVYPPANLVLSRTTTPASLTPGAVVTYVVKVTNKGGPASSVTATDLMSPYSTLVLGAYSGTPFLFQEGSPASRLSPGAPLYSTDGITWSSSPPAGGNLMNWKIPMNGTMDGTIDPVNGPFPNFSITFQGQVK